MAGGPRFFWGHIDLDALRHNYAEVRRLAGPDIKIMPAVKADGYGHGAVGVARALSDLGAFALVTGAFEEALAIRQAGVKTPILMLGHCPPEALPEVTAAGFIPTIVDMAGAAAVATSSGPPRAVYIKVDCGLRRLGVALEAADAFVRAVAAMPGVKIEGLYTHVPFHDNAGAEWSRARLAAFDGLVRRLAAAGIEIPVTQAMASANLLAGHSDASNAVCVGHLLYGLPCADGEIGDASAFKPVLAAVSTRLIHVSTHAGAPAGSAAGPSPYGRRNATTIGVIPVGLSDGLRSPREGQTMEMLVRGRRVPVLGVSLEHCVLDLGAVTNIGAAMPEVGDEVVVIGAEGKERIGLADLATWHGCSEREVMMLFAGRLPLDHGGPRPTPRR